MYALLPVESNITFAARPVGAIKTTRKPTEGSHLLNVRSKVVLPVPAYPCRIMAVLDLPSHKNWEKTSIALRCPSVGFKIHSFKKTSESIARFICIGFALFFCLVLMRKF